MASYMTDHFQLNIWLTWGPLGIGRAGNLSGSELRGCGHMKITKEPRGVGVGFKV